MNEDYIKDTVIGGTWLFLGNLTVSLTGLVFWIIIARLAGVENVGVASAIISATSIACVLVSAGMSIAIVREVAAKGIEIFPSILILVAIMGVAASFVSIVLVSMLGYSSQILVVMILTVSYILSMPFISATIGLERFRTYFFLLLLASFSKLIIGIVSVLFYSSYLAALLAFLSYYLVIIIAGTYFIGTLIKDIGFRTHLREMLSVATLALANYPFVFSSQLLSMLGVYAFAFVSREALSTGILYISLMITLSLASIPNMILNAALPIGTRRNVNPFVESYRIGLAFATPIIVTVAIAAAPILWIINPQLVNGYNTLVILLLSISPLTALTAAMFKLNKEKNIKAIALIGLMRLVVLMTLLPVLTNGYGVQGAAIAYLMANTLPLALIIKAEPRIIVIMTRLWGIQILILLVMILVNLSIIIKLVLSIVTVISLMHFTKTFSLSEMKQVTKIIFNIVRA